MRASWTSWLAISLWTISMILSICMLVLLYANGRLVDQLLLDGYVMYFPIAGSLVTVGALIAIHRPGNPIGWIFLIAALAGSVYGIADRYAYYITETAPNNLPEITLLFWLGTWAWIFAFILVPTFGILLFPTGRLPSRRWRPFAWLVAVWLALWVVVEMLSPGPLEPEGPISQFTNPIGIESMAGVFDVFLASINLVALVLFGLVVASIFARLRVSSEIERQQIKWFAYAAIVPLAGVVVFVLTGSHSRVNVGVGEYLILLGIAILPVAIGIAILRHNLYDIDRLINRTLVYGGLTALLGLGFAGSVVLFQFILSPFTSGNDLAVAGSTLLVAALFRPVRDRLQRFVDRRFYRRKYDAQRTLQAFSVTARDAVNLDELTGELTNVVATTMQPKHVSVWLPGGRPGKSGS